jgi:hypothetical protein
MVKRPPPGDDRQPDLLGGIRRGGPPPTAAVRRDRGTGARVPGRAGGQPGSTPPAAPPAEPTPTTLPARATPAELDAFVAALPDEALAHLALAGVRALRRRLAKARGAGPRAPRGGQGEGPLERAARRLTAELGGAVADDDS